MTEMKDLGVIILAGGDSKRFGTPKPFLQYDRGMTFLERISDVYLESSAAIVLVMNKMLRNEMESRLSELMKTISVIIWNDKPELGRFYSIKHGAEAAVNFDQCFIQNIDNPFTDSTLLAKLLESANDKAYVTPVFRDKGGHPVLVPKTIIKALTEEKDITLNTKDFLARYDRIKVDTGSEKVLVNINTQEDYNKYFGKTK